MRYITATVAGVMMAMLATVSFAESVSDKRGLTLEGAKKVIAATVAETKRVNAPGGSIAVVDDGGNLAVLIGDDEPMMHAARNYMVHASHRDKPGVVEIHEFDTDIVYVLKGSATLITGGTPVGTKTIAPHEFRAPTATGGDQRTLVPGDVVIIPNGVPHWFKEVEAPFDYYVVKVR